MVLLNMATIREWLKKTRENTKQKVKNSIEEAKDKTKDTYNKVLDTEIDDAQKQVKQATKNTSSFFRHIAISILASVHQFTRWALLPWAICIIAFGIFEFIEQYLYNFQDGILGVFSYVALVVLFCFSVFFFVRISYINILPKKFLKKLRNYALVIGTISLVIILFIIYRNSLCFDLRAGILEDPIYENSQRLIEFARAICLQ